MYMYIELEYDALYLQRIVLDFSSPQQPSPEIFLSSHIIFISDSDSYIVFREGMSHFFWISLSIIGTEWTINSLVIKKMRHDLSVSVGRSETKCIVSIRRRIDGRML